MRWDGLDEVGWIGLGGMDWMRWDGLDEVGWIG